MKHYQTDPYNALEAISEAQKIAFGPMLFQASWCLRETGVLTFLESRGQQGAPLADIARACELSEYGAGVLLDMGLGGGLCYLAEERYDDGSRFALIAALVPGAASAWVALAVLLVAAGLAWWRADPDRPWHAQTMLVGVVLLVVNPLYAWYALTLVPFVALSRRWEWLVVPFALSLNEGVAPRPVVLGAAVALVAIGSLVRWLRSRRGPIEGVA